MELPAHTTTVEFSLDVTVDVIWEPWTKRIHLTPDYGFIDLCMLAQKGDGQVYVGVGGCDQAEEIVVRRGDRAKPSLVLDCKTRQHWWISVFRNPPELPEPLDPHALLVPTIHIMMRFPASYRLERRLRSSQPELPRTFDLGKVTREDAVVVDHHLNPCKTRPPRILRLRSVPARASMLPPSASGWLVFRMRGRSALCVERWRTATGAGRLLAGTPGAVWHEEADADGPPLVFDLGRLRTVNTNMEMLLKFLWGASTGICWGGWKPVHCSDAKRLAQFIGMDPPCHRLWQCYGSWISAETTATLY